MKPGRQALLIGVIGALILALYGLVLGRAAHSPELAENNYEANLLRIEKYFFGPAPSVALVGSSLTGRLLPSYFAAAGAGTVANLGLDGSGPAYGLSVIIRRQPVPRLVLVEANLLGQPEGINERTLDVALGNLAFRLGKHCPLFLASARPSTRLYARLKAARDESTRGASPTNSSSAKLQMPGPPPPGSAFKELLRGRIEALRTRGTEVVLFRMPSGHPWVETPSDFAAQEAAELGIPIIDLYGELLRRKVELSYTDGLHLGARSAREAVRILFEIWPKETAAR